MSFEDKDIEMKVALNELSYNTFGISIQEAIQKGICVICKKEAKVFKDNLSRVEYKISGMCQECQDKVFE